MTDTQKEEDSKLLHDFYIGLFALWPTLLLASTLGFLTLLFQSKSHEATLGFLYAPVTGFLMGVFIWASSYCMARMVGAYNMMNEAIWKKTTSKHTAEEDTLEKIAKKDPLSAFGLYGAIEKYLRVAYILAFALPATLYTLLLIAYYPGTSEVLAAAAALLLTVTLTAVAFYYNTKKTENHEQVDDHTPPRRQ